jgi:hypothetical protein
VEGLITYFEWYKETRFLQGLMIAKGIARELDVAAKFPKKARTKKQFDENPDDTNVSTQSKGKSFRINYFIPLVDQPISSPKPGLSNMRVIRELLVSYLPLIQ